MPGKLLILDLDETLVYAADEPLDRPADFGVGTYHVYRRPFLAEFLATVSQWYTLAVWTSAGTAYGSGIVQAIFPPTLALAFVWYGPRCTMRLDLETRDYYHIKNLRKVKREGYALEHVVMLDDSSEKLERNYGNHLRLNAFFGDRADTELRDVLPFLNYLRTVENVRAIEKRTWRDWRPTGADQEGDVRA